jgi:alkaline phosphatase
MNKKFIPTLLLLFAFSLYATGQAKYVFYFIGDGMGINQVNGTEMYLAEQQGRIGVEPLLFTGFPVASFATTFSANRGVTDSAAAGTALATGKKTSNGTISMDTAHAEAFVSIAEKAKAKGTRVGITSTVSLNDATPAAFYGHQSSRNKTYPLCMDMLKANFDFFGGPGFANPGKGADNAYDKMKAAGYSVVYGYDEYKANAADRSKVVLLNNRGADTHGLTLAIDRQPGDLTLAQVTECAIQTLSQNARKGFFLMVEGGSIDHGGHVNDAATDFAEVIDLNEAVKVAYEFYKKHPKETLIVVTADHETGGIVLGRGMLNLKVLSHQKVSQDKLSDDIRALRDRKDHNVTWEEVKALLSDRMGLWSKVPLTAEQDMSLYRAYAKSFIAGDRTEVKSLYQSDEQLAAAAKKVLNDIAGVSWASGAHSAGYVPVFAIGAGAELFNGKMDNTDIPKRIAKAARY